MSNTIYHFGWNGTADGDASMKDLLGGKGANLAEMAKNGLPIPQGFTIPTTICNAYHAAGDNIAKAEILDDLLDNHVFPAIVAMKEALGYRPLVSVRSGARVSMPGMMDTVLNVGFTEPVMDEWQKRIGDRTTLDSYRRLMQMYGDVVLGIPLEDFEKKWAEYKTYKFDLKQPPEDDSQMTVKHLTKVIREYGKIYKKHGHELPKTMKGQLRGAVEAVFDSWNSERAVHYRKMHGYPDSWGTAVNIQLMVFGNANDQSCSGVLFSRDPADGHNEVVGEYLPNAQGEDVVAGIRTPEPLGNMSEWNHGVLADLEEIAINMEAHYNDMQDMEFTVQDGKLYILQTRTGKRTAQAAFRIAYDMLHEGAIDIETALSRVTIDQYLALQTDHIDPNFNQSHDGTGIPAGGAVVTGVAVFSSEDAVNCNEPCILVAEETTPDDIKGMEASVGILTRTGGTTCHAAVVARAMDKTCVVGCTKMKYLEESHMWELGDEDIAPGTTLTIDGSTGKIWVDVVVPVVKAEPNDYAEGLIDLGMASSDVIQRIDVLTDDMPDEGTVYIDTLSATTQTDISNVLQAIYDSNNAVDRVLLNLSGIEHHRSSEDIQLWGAFGDADDKDTLLGMKVAAMVSEHASEHVKDKTFIIIPPHSPKAYKESLKDDGWSVISTVTNIEELLDAESMADISPELRVAVGGDEAYAKLMEVFKLAGKVFQPVPKAMSRTRMVFDLLGKAM